MTDMDGTKVAEHVDALTTEQLVAAGLERRGESLLEWSDRNSHHRGRVVEAWRRGWIIPRGHDSSGLLCCTLVPSLDPSHLDHGGGRTQGEYSTQPAALRDAEAAHDAAEAERAEADHDADEPGAANPAPGHDEHAGRHAGKANRTQNRERMTLHDHTEATA